MDAADFLRDAPMDEEEQARRARTRRRGAAAREAGKSVSHGGQCAAGRLAPRPGADAPPPRALQLATGTQAPARVVAEEGRTSEEGVPEKDAFATPTGAKEPQARRAAERCARA